MLLCAFTNAADSENASGLTLDRVTIWSVSTDLAISNSNREGSINGGTMLYIKATGQDQTASNNRVMVGPYECIIPDKGVNEVFVSCMTTAAWDPLQRWDLPVELFVVPKG